MATTEKPAVQALNVPSTTQSAWDFDAAHTSVEFAVKHMMISTVTGRMKLVRGEILVDENRPEGATVEIEIDAGSLDTGIADRDSHLRSPDFFDVANHPKIVFKSTRAVRLGEAAGKLEGELTIRGATRPVTLDVEFEGEGKDPWGAHRTGFTATTTVNRKDFGLNWNMVLDNGGVLVGDKAKITIRAEAVRRKAQARGDTPAGG